MRKCVFVYFFKVALSVKNVNSVCGFANHVAEFTLTVFLPSTNFVLFAFFRGNDFRLVRQPLGPVLGELVDVRLGDGDEGADFLHGRGIFLVDDFLDEQLDGAVTPFIALLGE